METLASILCLIQSLYIFTTKDLTIYSFDWRSDGFFITALLLNLITVVVVFSLFILHKCYWEKAYNRPRDTSGKVQVLKKVHWRNPECDKYFYNEIKKGKITVLWSIINTYNIVLLSVKYQIIKITFYCWIFVPAKSTTKTSHSILMISLQNYENFSRFISLESLLVRWAIENLELSLKESFLPLSLYWID